MNEITCPSCKSEDVKLVERRNDNGVIGPGYHSWITDSYYSCKKCGTRFDSSNPLRAGRDTKSDGI